MDGPGGYQTGRSKRLKQDGPKDLKWTVQRKKTVRSEEMNLNGLKGQKRRSIGMKLDGSKV